MLTIAIQAGGLSSRMGQDKALMPFLDRPLIAHLVDRLKGSADELLVTTNHPQNFAFLGVPLFSDILPGLGALGGLYTALFVSSQPLVAVIACDMPFIEPALLRAQLDLLQKEGADIVIPRSPDGLEPLHAVYRRETCLPAVYAALQAGERKMIAWHSGYQAYPGYAAVRLRVMASEEVAVVDPQFRSFINVNTQEEFRQAEELARRSG
jgi:molybdenum cofactor guanylyltransferase